MRQSCVLSGLVFTSFVIGFATSFAPSFAVATPVFLKPQSRFATGNQARAKLETRTRKYLLQRWFRVKTKDRMYGWIAEDHALTALKLVDQAFLIEAVPARTSPDVDATAGRPLIASGTPMMVLEINGSWSRVQPLTEGDLPQAWVPNEKLKANLAGNLSQRAFVYQTTALHLDADVKSRALLKVEEGTYVQIVRTRGAFLEVRSDRFQGFILRTDAWTADDLGDKGVRAAVSLAPLRSTPLPYADLVRSLPYSSTLTLVSTASLKWGLASTREQGDVWWPMADDGTLNESGVSSVAEVEKLTTPQMFARKIFDMATSRSIPSLKFVSAGGIFRTIDDKVWTKLPFFGEQNYPIAVSKSGSIFIGPYVSDDHGETFQQWIRWDSLVSSLEKQSDVSAQNLKILEIHPEDSLGRKVSLRLNVGLKNPIHVATEDQGASWRSY